MFKQNATNSQTCVIFLIVYSSVFKLNNEHWIVTAIVKRSIRHSHINPGQVETPELESHPTSTCMFSASSTVACAKLDHYMNQITDHTVVHFYCTFHTEAVCNELCQPQFSTAHHSMNMRRTSRYEMRHVLNCSTKTCTKRTQTTRNTIETRVFPRSFVCGLILGIFPDRLLCNY